MMDETIYDPQRHFVPKLAIVGYEAHNEYYGNGACYFSKHPIIGGKLGAGAPLTQEMVKDILKLVDVESNEYTFKGRLPKQLLYFKDKGQLLLVWYCDRKTERLLFKEGLDIPTASYPLPKLIFVLNGNTLFVYAIKRKTPLHDGTQLYHAPFMNVYSPGSVCMGDVSVDYGRFGHYEDIMDFAEKQFFMSLFTHTNHNDLLDGNFVELMCQMKGRQAFDEKLLIPNHKTLCDTYGN